MQFHPTNLDGAWLITADPVYDERGFFARTFCTREFADRGLATRYVQHSTSFSRARGTIRGMHFQHPPHSEIKVVSCLKGAIWDVIIDLRPESPTFRSWSGFELSDTNRKQLYVPKGFAHGFQTLTDDTIVAYLISEFYTPEATAGVRYDDPAFAITWPLPVSVISKKDTEWALFSL